MTYINQARIGASNVGQAALEYWNIAGNSEVSFLVTSSEYTTAWANAAEAATILGISAISDALTAHLNDTTDAHDASAISVVDAGGNFTGADVETVLAELASMSGGAVTADSVTYAGGLDMVATNVESALDELADKIDNLQYTFAEKSDEGHTHDDRYYKLSTDLATQAELDAHINDTTDAHDASAISILDVAGDFTATDVEGALAELQSDAEADATALSDHIADATDAHDASAISVSDAGSYFTGTDVETALQELGAASSASIGVDDVSGLDYVLAEKSDEGHHHDERYHKLSTDLITQSEFDAHKNGVGSSYAHFAQDIFLVDSASDFTAVNVETAFAEVQTDIEALQAHLTDTVDAHDASAISYNGATGISATDVEGGLDELAAEKADITAAVMDGDTAGGVLSGTYPNPGFAVDMATQAELDAHTGDTTAAHAASAISVDSTTLVGTGTDVQAVFEEIDNGVATVTSDLSSHLSDATDAHDASAISVVDAGTYYTGTDVEAVLQEVGAALGGGSYVDVAGDTMTGSLVLSYASPILELDASAGQSLLILDSSTGNTSSVVHQIDNAEIGQHYASVNEVGTIVIVGGVSKDVIRGAVASGNVVLGNTTGTLTSAATPPAATDDSTKVATTAWTQDAIDEHRNDTSDAHDASAISIVDAGGYFSGSDVEAALQEVGAATTGITSVGDVVGLDYVLAEKSDEGHAHDDRYIPISPSAAKIAANKAGVVTWDQLEYVLSEFSNEGHAHDDRYAVEHSCRMYRNAALNLASSASYQLITLDTIEWDYRDSSLSAQGDTANNRIYCRKAGRYLVTGTTGVANTTLAVAAIYKNGSLFASQRQTDSGGGTKYATVSKVMDLAVGDYIQLYGFSNHATGTVTTVQTSLEMFRLKAAT